MKKQLLALAVISLLSANVFAENTATTADNSPQIAKVTNTTAENASSVTSSKKTTPKIVAPKRENVILNSTDVFKVVLNEPINTKSNVVGDAISFTVVDDVKVGNALVIASGTTGEGQISALKKGRSFGRNGSLDISFDEISAVDGTTFSAIQGAEAKEQTKTSLKAAGASVAGVAVLGPVGLVGGFFVKGKDVDLPSGTEIYVQPTAAVAIEGYVGMNGDKYFEYLDNMKKAEAEKLAAKETAKSSTVKPTTDKTTVNATDKNDGKTNPVGNADIKEKPDMNTTESDSDSKTTKSEKVNQITDDTSTTVETTENVAPSSAIVVVKRS